MERKGNFTRYMEESRAHVVAEVGQMEALGFNMRALKGHVAQVDAAPWQQQMVDGMLDAQQVFKNEDVVFQAVSNIPKEA
jgi:hypothetical protein